MTATRQDAWTEDDDLLLAEVVLRHIREGSTQLNAFEEVGYRLGRTSAACGFRWNSLVRKKYESAIQIAKAQRQQRKARGKNRFTQDEFIMSSASERMDKYQGQPQSSTNGTTQTIYSDYNSDLRERKELHDKDVHDEAHDQDSDISFDQVIKFLRQQKDSFKKIRQTEKELYEKELENKRLREENEKMKRELGTVQNDYQTINDDYKALIQIMDRARKLAFLGEDTEEKVSFKMDKNGNLERVEKS